MRGNFNKLTSNYKDLVKILPTILGKSLPSTLDKLGQFDIRGKTEITTSAIAADFYMTTSLGNLQSNLKMTRIDNIDNASYKGNLILEHFKIGKFLGKRDLDFVKKTLLNLGSFGGDGQLLTIQAAKTNKIFVQRQRLPRSFKNRNRNFNKSEIEIKSEKDPFRNT